MAATGRRLTRFRRSPTVAAEPLSDGSVRVRIRVAATPEAAWSALVDPICAREWFAEATAELRTGRRLRFDFGDGDFFNADVLDCQPLRRLRYAWRFLGIGPQAMITWRLAPTNGGVELIANDEQTGRGQAEATELSGGWVDFGERLALFLTTSVRSRYDWRRDLDASIEVTAAPDVVSERLFATEAAREWLSLVPAARATGRLWMSDGEAPSEFEVDGLTVAGGVLSFGLQSPQWRGPTACRLSVTRRPGGSRLAVSHIGWPDIGDDASEQLCQRRRFCQWWAVSLLRARRLLRSLR
jgi:uncharacterized protein YndB with AHSA1/START domain